MKKNVLISSIIGNMLEYYDFTIFAVFSVEIGQLFFPKQDVFLQTLASLAVFAVGFLMRPLGAMLFGHMGDRIGRKQALTYSLVCMAIPTLLIGCLPAYNILGIWAPVMLIVLRLIQGVSIGGEGAGTAIFILEHHPHSEMGRLGGIITASNFTGAFIATLLGVLISQLGLTNSHWRFAFILGGLLGFIGLYLRVTAEETPVFEKMVKENKVEESPLSKSLAEYRYEMLLSCCLGGVVGAFAHTILAYINLFFTQQVGFSSSLSLMYAALGIGSFILFLPFSGYYSDKVGYMKSFIYGCYATIMLVLPLFVIMGAGYGPTCIITIILFGALASWVCAPAYPIMLQIFPPELRFSGIAASFNVGIALFGGTAPVFSALLTRLTGSIYSPAFYLMALAILYCGCYFYLTQKNLYKSVFG